MLRDPAADQLDLLRRIAELVGLERTRADGNPCLMAASLVSVATLLIETNAADRAALVRFLREEARRLDKVPSA